MKLSHPTLALLLGLLLLAIGVTAAWRSGLYPHLQTSPPPPELEYVLLPEPVELPPFHLTDFNEEEFGIGRFIGRWTLLFFGYTHCPDVCPTTLAELKEMHSLLLQQDPEAAAELQFYFISLDPKRDSLAGLKTYLGYFDPAFVGATGSRETIDQLTREGRIGYLVEGDPAGEDYIINHSATLLLLDPQGRIYAQLNPPHTPAGLATKFLRVREFYSR